MSVSHKELQTRNTPATAKGTQSSLGNGKLVNVSKYMEDSVEKTNPSSLKNVCSTKGLHKSLSVIGERLATEQPLNPPPATPPFNQTLYCSIEKAQQYDSGSTERDAQ